jgi:hypothetical protein
VLLIFTVKEIWNEPIKTLLIGILSDKLPNVVVEWLTLLLRIREVPVSNLDPETGCPD